MIIMILAVEDDEPHFSDRKVIYSIESIISISKHRHLVGLSVSAYAAINCRSRTMSSVGAVTCFPCQNHADTMFL